jgi:hypothetical protein
VTSTSSFHSFIEGEFIVQGNPLSLAIRCEFCQSYVDPFLTTIVEGQTVCVDVDACLTAADQFVVGAELPVIEGEFFVVEAA